MLECQQEQSKSNKNKRQNKNKQTNNQASISGNDSQNKIRKLECHILTSTWKLGASRSQDTMLPFSFLMEFLFRSGPSILPPTPNHPQDFPPKIYPAYKKCGERGWSRTGGMNRGQAITSPTRDPPHRPAPIPDTSNASLLHCSY